MHNTQARVSTCPPAEVGSEVLYSVVCSRKKLLDCFWKDSENVGWCACARATGSSVHAGSACRRERVRRRRPRRSKPKMAERRAREREHTREQRDAVLGLGERPCWGRKNACGRKWGYRDRYLKSRARVAGRLLRRQTLSKAWS